MAFSNLFEHGEKKRKLSHFASIMRMAKVDGVLKDEEKDLLYRFARKLDVTEEEFHNISKKPDLYPLEIANTANARLERMLDLFKMIFADSQIDEEERKLVERYAIGLGYTEDLATELIEKSIKIFQGGLDLEDYRYLLNRK